MKIEKILCEGLWISYSILHVLAILKFTILLENKPEQPWKYYSSYNLKRAQKGTLSGYCRPTIKGVHKHNR